MMFSHSDTKVLTYHLRNLRILVLHLFLIHLCRGQFQLISSPQPVIALVGDDVILPCRLQPIIGASITKVEWTKPGVHPKYIHIHQDGRLLYDIQNPSYHFRTMLFVNELLNGNASMKIFSVKPSDEGKYRCYIPSVQKEAFTQLIVGAISSAIVSITGTNAITSTVMLQCESKGWYPEPEVLWLEAEGNLLSVGPTETVRGPDDLYTVISRVTVEKRRNNTFTCRVQQKNINQTRETHIHVSDDFFMLPSSSTDSAVTGLAVSFTVTIIIIFLIIIFLWKHKHIIFTTNRSQCDETDKGQMKNSSKGETEHLVTEDEKRNHKKRSEQKSKKEVKHKLKTLRKILETYRNQVRDKQAEVDQLSEEKQRMKEELQTLNEELENKNQELETIGDELSQYFKFSLNPRRSELQKKKEEVEQEVETLKKKVETKETEIQTKTEQFEEKQVELQQLQDKRQSTVTDLQSQEKELMFIKLEGGRTDIFRQLQQEKEEMMREVERLNIQQESMKAEFENKLQAEQEAVAKDVLLKKQLQKKIKELDKQLSAEKKERMESEKEMNKYITELEKQLSVGTQLMLETGSLKKQLEKRNSELQKRIRAEEQKKMEIEILKSQLEKNNTQLQAEKQRREKEAAALKEEKVMKSNPGPGEEMDLTTVQSVEENHNEEEIQQKPTSDTVTDDIPS